MKNVLALDIGGTNIKYAIVNEKGDIADNTRIKTPLEYNLLLDNIAYIYHEVKGSVEGVSIAIPGGYDYSSKKVFAPNLQSLNGNSIVEDLSNLLQTEVVAENDANLAALGEYVFADKKAYNNLIFVTLGTGFGGGIIVDGKLPKSSCSIFEIGHTIIQQNGRQCGCGRQGCLDEYVTSDGLIATYHEIANNNDDVSPTIIHELATQGDKYAIEAFNTFAVTLADGLINVANLFCPDKIKIGGGLSNFSDCFLDKTLEQFDNNIFPLYKGKVVVEIASLGNNAGVLGAAANFFKL